MKPIEYFVGKYPYLGNPLFLSEIDRLFLKKRHSFRSPVGIDTSCNTEHLVVAGRGAMEVAIAGAEGKIAQIRKARGITGPVACVMCVVSLSDGTVLTTNAHGRVESDPRVVGNTKRLSTWIPPDLSEKDASLHLCVCFSPQKGATTRFTHATVVKKDFRFKKLSPEDLKEILLKSCTIPRMNPYSTYILELTEDREDMERFLVRETVSSYDELLPNVSVILESVWNALLFGFDAIAGIFRPLFLRWQEE
jgi:hypothetical protein